ncbi:MAG: HPr(Ser) kinase/phosphatase [Lentisphaerae bacterium]|nr:HPr(Ser) kinase/phosphatase [Lentisphaerota bacterium]
MSVTVGQFYEAAKSKVDLEWVTGEGGLSRTIIEPAINRPGLALAGYTRHFAFRRLQVLGMAEMDYLLRMASDRRRASLRELFSRRIPCLVISRNRKVFPEILALSDEFQVPVMKTPMVTGAFINAATIIMENLMAPRMTLQGTMVDILGIGVVMEGKPRIGKSEVALALVERGYSLVSDDVTVLRRTDDRTLVGSSMPITRYHLELRGLGIIHVPSLFGVASVREEKELDLIVTLLRIEEFADMESGLTPKTRELLGVRIPHLVIPVAPGREMANIIEVATLNEKLKRLGHDAAKELDEKLMSVMAKGKVNT